MFLKMDFCSELKEAAFEYASKTVFKNEKTLCKVSWIATENKYNHSFVMY